MNRNELEQLAPPGSGQHLPAVRVEIEKICDGHTALLAAYDRTRPAVLRAAALTDIEIEGAHLPFNNAHAVQRRIEAATADFRRDALPKFYRLKSESAGRALLAIEAEKTRLETEVESRINRLGVALGRVLGDEQAGLDLAAMLTRMAGIAPDLANKLRMIQDARNAWDCAASRSAGLAAAAEKSAAENPPVAIVTRADAITKLENEIGE